MDGLFDHLFKPAISASGDYTGEDGLLHCGRCHARKERPLELPGGILFVRVLCKCEAAARDAEEAKLAELERIQRIERRRDDAISDSRLRESTFDKDDGKNPITTAMRKYAQCFDRMRESNTGLLMFGPVGTGKTFFAACIVNEVCKSWTARMTSFARIAERISENMNLRKNIIRELTECDLLVLDDLGAERQNSYMSEIVFEVVDARYSSKRPAIITTNLTLEEIKHPRDPQYIRIYDRITEMCEPVLIDGPSRRTEKARNRAGTREFLGI